MGCWSHEAEALHQLINPEAATNAMEAAGSRSLPPSMDDTLCMKSGRSNTQKAPVMDLTSEEWKPVFLMSTPPEILTMIASSVSLTESKVLLISDCTLMAD